jgi:hypothetical protein
MTAPAPCCNADIISGTPADPQDISLHFFRGLV